MADSGVIDNDDDANAAPKKQAAAPNQSREVAVFEDHQTKKQKVSIPTVAASSLRGQPMTMVKVHAPPGLLGFILKPKKSNQAAVTITKINKTCVVKDQIQVGDQLIGVDDDYFPYFPTRDLVQFIKNKQSNPVRILTFNRYKKDKIWDIVQVIPTAEEQSHATSRNAPKTQQCLGHPI